MKLRSTTAGKLFTKLMSLAVIILCSLIAPGVAVAQEPGSNPDIPLDMTGVPISWEMNLAFLAFTVIFAVVIVRKRAKKRLLAAK